MNIISFRGFKTECKIIGDSIVEVDSNNRVPYDATPDIFHKFIKIENIQDACNFCSDHGFLNLDIYPGKQFAYNFDGNKNAYSENVLDILTIRNALKSIIELWNLYNSVDSDYTSKIDVIYKIKNEINLETNKKVITDISINYPQNIEDDNEMLINKKKPLVLKVNCLTLKSYIYFTFFNIIIKGNILKTCSVCGRYFETTANSLKKYCDLCGEQERNRKKIYNYRAKDKSIVYIDNLINKRLKRDVMDTLPGPLRKKFEEDAMRLKEQWKSLQNQYREGNISIDDLKSITTNQLIEFKNILV
jgi:hypothetical protein